MATNSSSGTLAGGKIAPNNTVEAKGSGGGGGQGGHGKGSFAAGRSSKPPEATAKGRVSKTGDYPNPVRGGGMVGTANKGTPSIKAHPASRSPKSR